MNPIQIHKPRFDDDDDVDDDVDDNRWETEPARMTSSPRAAVAVVIPRTN